MKKLSGHIKSVIMVLACILSMDSCIYDYDTYDQTAETEDSDKALFVLHIMPVNTRGDLPGSVVERIKSLRVIAISKGEEGEDDVIEINRLVTFNDEASADFGYAFTWHTTSGNKDFYIIANEESVPSISFEDAADNLLPKEVKTLTNLTALLNHYKATPNSGEFRLTPSTSSKSTADNKTGESDMACDVAEFKKAINAVYFSPTYEIQEIQGDEKKQIFLPYTTCYENVEVKALKDNGFKENSKTMYLVPVATKFIFNFYNYRLSPVYVNEISMKSINTNNFLVPRVGETDLKKAFDGTEYAWIDWLAKVSEASHDNMGFNENVDFNEKYGWISDYEMPEETLEATTFVEQKNRIPGGDEDSPSKVSFGPYYRPESKKLKNADGQEYYLTISLDDTVEGKQAPKLEDLLISNLKALFRNTCVIINVTMRDGDVEVYAEIADWNKKKANGWVVEGHEPNLTP